MASPSPGVPVFPMTAAIALIAAAARAACPDFNVPLPIGSNAGGSVVVGDFNRDGILDFAVTGDVLRIYLGDGAGGFNLASTNTLTVPNGPIATADLNGDGKLDLVVGQPSANNVLIFIGSGDGNFTQTGTFATGNGPQAIAVADFNRDGKLDLAVVDSTSNAVSILLGDGTGSFGTKTDFPVGNSPNAIVAADFNRDGKVDFAVSNGGEHTVSVRFGDGSGGFGSVVTLTLESTENPLAIAAGSFSGTGLVDLVTADSGSFAGTLFVNNGAGGFFPAIHFGTPLFGGFGAIAVADFNGDGKSDVALSRAGFSGTAVLLGDGNAGFNTQSMFSGFIALHDLAVGDFNRDGRPDIVTTGGTGITVLTNTGTCTTTCAQPATATAFSAGTNPQGSVIADFNADGAPDIAVVNEASDTVSVRLGDGNGGFGPETTYATGSQPVAVAAADINGDGRLDLVVANKNGSNVSVLIGGGGTFGTATNFSVGSTPCGPAGVAVGDLNGDGKPDIAVSCATSGEVSVLLNTSTPGAQPPTFQAASNYSVATGQGLRGIALGDFNRDGKLDIAAADYGDGVHGGNVAILLNGTFNAPAYSAVGVGPVGIAVADLNRDGHLDIAVTNSVDNNVSVLIDNGSGTFVPAGPFAAGTTPVSVAAGDFNGDGKLDLVTANSGSNNVSVLIGNGSGSFAAANNFAAGTSPAAVSFADLNRDGRLDIVATASEGAEVLLVACPDVGVSSQHADPFHQGQVGATYFINVSNAVGAATTSGTVTVSDSVPPNVTPTAISGDGWTCTLGTTNTPSTCSRSDALNGSTSWPAIALTVDVANTSPLPFGVNVVTVMGGGDTNGLNNVANDTTNFYVNPSFSIAFSPTNIGLGFSSTLTFTIADPNFGNVTPFSNLSFTDSLPSGLVVANPNAVVTNNGCGGTVTALAGSGSIALSGGTSRQQLTCTYSVNVTGSQVGTQNNSATLSTNELGTGPTANASINVYQPPQVSFIFDVPDVNPGGTVSFAIRITNLNAIPLTNLAFTDNAPAGTAFFNTPPLSNSCGGSATVSGLPLRGSLSGGSVAANGLCQVVFFLSAITPGLAVNTVTVSSAEAGSGVGSGSVAIVVPPTVSAAFGASNIPLNSTTTLTFTISNPDAVPLTFVSFDPTTVSAGLTVSNGSTNCSGASFSAHDNVIALVGATIPAGGNCTFTMSVLGTLGGSQSVTVPTIFSVEAGRGPGASASIIVMTPPQVSAVFSATQVPLNGTAGFVFTFTNNNVLDILGVAFTDTLPAGLVIANPSNVSTNCGGTPTITAVSGSNTFTVSGLRAYSAFPCTFELSVLATTIGMKSTTTSAFTTSNAGTGVAASATLTVLVADLTIAKTHSGNFTQGDRNKSYTITVTNSGSWPTSGTITVVDTLPAGLTATSANGDSTSWTCLVRNPTVTCTLSDSITNGASATISVFVTVSSNATPGTVTNTVTVSGGGEIDTSNNSASDPTTIAAATGLVPPTNLVATAISQTQVALRWDAVVGAARYRISRFTGPNFVDLGFTANSSPTFMDGTVVPNTSYAYFVASVSSSGTQTDHGNIDIATTKFFSEDPVTPGMTAKALHILELRDMVDRVRAISSKPPFTYSNAITVGSVIHATDIIELRSALSEELTALGIFPTYTDPALAAGALVKAAHIQDLRNFTK